MRPKNLSYIVTGVSLVYIFVNLFTYSMEFEVSSEFAIWMQSYRNGFLDFFMGIWSFLGFPFLAIGLIVYIFVEPNKFTAYKVTFFCINVGFLNGLLKLFYTSPRPWYANEKIQAMECGAIDFGRPSGHSMFSLYVGLMFYKTYIYDRGNNYNSEESFFPADGEDYKNRIFKSGESMKKQIFCAYVIFVGLVGLSRIYRGAHSLDQVLLGYSCSIVCWHLTVYHLEKPVEDLFDFYGGRRWVNFKKHVLILVLVFLACLLVPIIIYAIKDRTLNLEPWLIQIKAKCGISDPKKVLLVLSLYSAAFDSLTFGLLFGLMFAYRNLLRTRASYRDRKSNAMKVLLSLGVVAFLGFLNYILPVGNSPYAVYLIKICSFLFLVMFFLVAVLPRVFRKLKLEKEWEQVEGGPATIDAVNVRDIENLSI